MTRKITILMVVIIAVAGAVLFWLRNDFFSLSGKLDNIKKSTDVVLQDIKKEIINPPPLRATRESEQAYLTRGGVIKWTNMHRTNTGLSVLAENPQLNAAAQLKVQDMFDRQYFEHISPTGGNVGTLLDGIAYRYIAVGENLALGNYENDQVLVRAWMDSPGHRANILNSRFREIGVAVAKRTFEGKLTWLAVQTFALPLSSCPQVEESLKTQITYFESQVAELKIKADGILDELEKYKKYGNREEYNRKIEEYNALVKQINDLVAQAKSLVIKYNEQVRVFNTCIMNK